MPSGASHFRIINAIAVVSDFVYNTATNAYEPAEPTLNELSHIAYSDFIPVNEVTSLLDVTASLPDSPTLTTNVSVLGCVGIEFYQEVAGNYYLFNAGNAMKIQEVF